MSRRIVLEDHKQKLADRGIDIEVSDGQVFHVDPPQLWSDEAMELAGIGDSMGLAKVVLGGTERYDAFVSAGGSAALLSSIIEGGFEATLPES